MKTFLICEDYKICSVFHCEYKYPQTKNHVYCLSLSNREFYLECDSRDKIKHIVICTKQNCGISSGYKALKRIKI